MLHWISLYFFLIGKHLKKLFTYRADFLIGIFGFLISQSAQFFTLYIIFAHIPALSGWNFYQVVFIYGFALIPRGIDHLLTDNLWALSGRLVKTGEFDRYLLKPMPPLFQLISEVFQFDALGEIALGIVLVFTASAQLGLEWALISYLQLVLFISIGFLVYFFIKLIFASIAFWTGVSQNVLYMVYMVSDFAKYPTTIYNQGLQFFLITILPFAFVGFYPAAVLLGKTTFVDYIVVVAPVIAMLSSIAVVIWRKGIRHYNSSGS